jgi:hypothetical protein
MKKLLLLFTTLFIIQWVNAQLKTTVKCDLITVDLLDGKVNGVRPDYNSAIIKKALPCFSSEEPEDATSKCGGGVFYKDKDLYFYTGRDYVEIGDKFKGKLSVPLLGASRNNLFRWLGNAAIKDVSWDAYQTSYGILILYYNKAGKVNKIQFSTKNSDTIKLCQ